ncbi:MAG: tyrosine-type recombinase/integrase [Planctomycetes bacterium]|nr:tyrosine-type recombinase/integrase [Planctomycetota bacterium]
MRLFKPEWKGPDGEVRTTSKWYVAWKDNRGTLRRIAAFTDKSASAELGRRLDRLSAMRATGQPLPPEMRAWIEGLPASIRLKLAGQTKARIVREVKRTPATVFASSPKMSMLDSKAFGATLRLDDLLGEFEASLLAKGNSPAHALRAKVRARRVFKGIGAEYFTEIDASAVEQFLRHEREKVRCRIGARTSNYLLQATRQFCRWFVRTGRAIEDPLRVLQPMNAAVDVRRQRRALSDDELRGILQAAETGAELYGLTGSDRAMLYRLAVETGLRANELRSLRVASFDLGSARPTVTVAAASSKRRREDTLPLKRITAQALAAYLRNRGPFAAAFPIAKSWRSAEMFAVDREAAGVAERDERGHVVDFHALRHTFITNLVRGGVAPKVAQALARHSTIVLTMDHYTHLRVEDQRDALDALPDLYVAEGRRATV